MAKVIVDLSNAHALGQIFRNELANPPDKRRKAERVGRQVVMNVGHFAGGDEGGIGEYELFFAKWELKVSEPLILLVCIYYHNFHLIEDGDSLTIGKYLLLETEIGAMRGIVHDADEGLRGVNKHNRAYPFDNIGEEDVDGSACEVGEGQERPLFVREYADLVLCLDRQVLDDLPDLKRVFINILLAAQRQRSRPLQHKHRWHFAFIHPCLQLSHQLHVDCHPIKRRCTNDKQGFFRKLWFAVCRLSPLKPKDGGGEMMEPYSRRRYLSMRWTILSMQSTRSPPSNFAFSKQSISCRRESAGTDMSRQKSMVEQTVMTTSKNMRTCLSRFILYLQIVITHQNIPSYLYSTPALAFPPKTCNKHNNYVIKIIDKMKQLGSKALQKIQNLIATKQTKTKTAPTKEKSLINFRASKIVDDDANVSPAKPSPNSPIKNTPEPAHNMQPPRFYIARQRQIKMLEKQTKAMYTELEQRVNFKMQNTHSFFLNKRNPKPPIYERAQDIIRQREALLQEKRQAKLRQKQEEQERQYEQYLKLQMSKQTISKEKAYQITDRLYKDHHIKNNRLNQKKIDRYMEESKLYREKPSINPASQEIYQIVAEKNKLQTDIIDRFGQYELEKATKNKESLAHYKNKYTPFKPLISNHSRMLVSTRDEKSPSLSRSNHCLSCHFMKGSAKNPSLDRSPNQSPIRDAFR